MLKASLVMNAASVILFSSKDPRHIHSNVQIARDQSLDNAARQFYELVQLEHDQLLTNGEGAN